MNHCPVIISFTEEVPDPCTGAFSKINPFDDIIGIQDYLIADKPEVGCIKLTGNMLHIERIPEVICCAFHDHDIITRKFGQLVEMPYIPVTRIGFLSLAVGQVFFHHHQATVSQAFNTLVTQRQVFHGKAVIRGQVKFTCGN